MSIIGSLLKFIAPYSKPSYPSTKLRTTMFPDPPSGMHASYIQRYGQDSCTHAWYVGAQIHRSDGVCVAGWMDGWMDGWMGGWVGGWVGGGREGGREGGTGWDGMGWDGMGWADGWMGGWVDGWICG